VEIKQQKLEKEKNEKYKEDKVAAKFCSGCGGKL
jgi:hypothetical protein